MGLVRFTTRQGKSYELGYSTPQEQDIVKRRFYEIAKREGGVRSSYWGSGQSLQPSSASALQRQDPTAIAQSERHTKLSGQFASAEFRDKPSATTYKYRGKTYKTSQDVQQAIRGRTMIEAGKLEVRKGFQRLKPKQSIDDSTKPTFKEYAKTKAGQLSDIYSGVTGSYLFKRKTGMTADEVAVEQFKIEKGKKERAKQTGVLKYIPQTSTYAYAYRTLPGTREEINLAKRMRENKNITIKAQQEQKKAIEEFSFGLAKVESETPKEVTEEQYLKYYQDIGKLRGELKDKGVTSTIKNKEIKFTSKELETKVLPTSIKFMAKFTKEGKLTKEGYMYKGGELTRDLGISMVGGGVLGATGIATKIPYISKLAVKSPKVVLGVGAGLGLGSIGFSGYTGWKEGKQLGIPKIGAISKASSTTAQLTGFGIGMYFGTKGYLEGLEKKIMKGQYTKSIKETRSGTEKISRDLYRGDAKQYGLYETKVKGTDIKIQSEVWSKGKYNKKMGVSDIFAQSKVKGMKGVDRVYSYGTGQETDKFVRIRLQTPISKKSYRVEDFIIKRSLLRQKKIPLFTSESQGTRAMSVKEYEHLVKLLYTSKTKTPILFRDKTAFTKTDLKGMFKHEKALTEFKGLTQQMIRTKDVPISLPKNYAGMLDYDDLASVKSFTSVSKTKVASQKLLKLQMKKLMKEGVVFVSDGVGKKGMVTFTSTTPKITIPEISTPDLLSTPTNLKPVVISQLGDLVPKMMGKLSPAISMTSTGLGVGVLSLKTDVSLKQLSKTKTAIKNKMLEKQILKIATSPKIKTKVSTRILTKTLITPVTSTKQIINQITTIPAPTITTTIPKTPIIPTPKIAFPGWDFGSKKKKKSKKQLKKKMKESLYYTPDFTAKALGISMKVPKSKISKLPKMAFTGLEIRPIIKGGF